MSSSGSSMVSRLRSESSCAPEDSALSMAIEEVDTDLERGRAEAGSDGAVVREAEAEAGTTGVEARVTGVGARVPGVDP